MKLAYLVILCICYVKTATAQVDSSHAVSHIDSLNATYSKFNPLDSIAVINSNVTDSLRHLTRQIDSIEQWASFQADIVASRYDSLVTTINKTIHSLADQVDSLAVHNPVADKLRATMDSSRQELVQLKSKAELQIDSIKSKALRRIEEVNIPPEMQSRVSTLKSSIDKSFAERSNGISARLKGINKSNPVSQSDLTLASPVLNNLDIPSIPNSSVVSSSASIAKDPSGLIESTQTPDLPGITDKTSSLSTSVQQAKEIKEQPIDKLVQSKASSLSEVKEIQQNFKVENMEALQSEQAMKEELKNQAQKIAVDHFAGKQQQLQGAINKISKYKSKYESISVISDIAKKSVSNTIERPLIDRVMLGINLQMSRRENAFLVDLNPYAGLSVTSLITLGIGWNQRFGYNWDLHKVNNDSRIFGPRVFGEFKLGKGFSSRAEVEIMNTQVPPATLPTGDPKNRQWVPGLFLGVEKEYTLIGPVRGTVSLMTRIINPNGQSPYGNIINMRFGFELPLKKRSVAH